jgi:hypothetical protein
MITPLRFAARFSVTGKEHRLEDAKTIMTRDAAAQKLALQIVDDGPAQFMAFTGADADSYQASAGTVKGEPGYPDLRQHVEDARSNQIPVETGFLTSHYNYQLIFGQPTFDLATGQPLPERKEPPLKPEPVQRRLSPV